MADVARIVEEHVRGDTRAIGSAPTRTQIPHPSARPAGHARSRFPKAAAAIFVHGCFWHRHPGCKKATSPKSRVDFWQEKFDRNVKRDRANLDALAALGWRSEVIWECETKAPHLLSARLNAIFGKVEAKDAV